MRNFFFRLSKSSREGQAMILIAVSLGGILLVLTSVVGLLTFLQIRQAGDVANANVADYAADAGFNYGTYRFVFGPEIANGTKAPPAADPAAVDPGTGEALLENIGQIGQNTFRFASNHSVRFRFGCKIIDPDPTVPPADTDCTDSTSNLLISIGKTNSQSRTLLRTLQIGP